jgi:glycosyltransferase involved in cell wall biosynthesis
VDDKSPIDGVSDFIQGFNSSKISLHTNERNLGQAGNWNVCKSLCKTDFFVLLHADDELKQDYLAEMRAEFEARPNTAAMFCRADIINESGAVIASFVDFVKSFFVAKHQTVSLEGEPGLTKLIAGNFIMCPTVIYRKRLVDRIDFRDSWPSIPDLSYWAALLLGGLRIEGIPGNHFRYRRHMDSCTSEVTKSTKIFEEEASFFRNLASCCFAQQWPTAGAAAARMRIVKLRTIYFLFQDLIRFDYIAVMQKVRFLIRLSC